MPWHLFAIFNLLGAVFWVTVISVVGYLFGRNWPLLMEVFGRFDVAVAAIVVALLIFLWWRKRRQRAE
jgi:membrane protein DedA with SNARE-associated domain